MDRRRYLVALVGLSSLAGCSAGGGSPSPTGTSVRITTTGGDGIEFLVSQLAIRDDAPGPLAYYRLRNTADADATLKVETVLAIEGGGTYSAFAYATVPAGDEVTVSYPVVSFEALTAAERRRLERGDGVEFDVLVNGLERTDV